MRSPIPELQREVDDENSHASRQLLRLHSAALSYHNPTILELGTGPGASTQVFLAACDDRDGHLVSVDIEDCSDVAASDRWTFVNESSLEVERILGAQPKLHDGICVLYVDSLHKARHVRAEVEAWSSYVVAGGRIFFDDVDASPYRRGRRKDNRFHEKDWDEIHSLILAYFAANEDSCSLDIMYGSTGLACITKLTPLGVPLREPDMSSVRRRSTVLSGAYVTLANLRR